MLNRFGFSVAFLLVLISGFSSALSNAEEIVIGPSGGNPVSAGFQLKLALENLKAGDSLTVLDGQYTLPGGVEIGGLRPDGQFKRLDGWKDKVTVIKAANRRKAIIRGNLEFRGSFVQIEGLVIKGARGSNDRPGIEITDSHNVDVIDNEVAFCGGGGINFNQSDMILISRNLVHDNGTRNSEQHSGISVYQPVNYRANPRERHWGVLITRNISHSNRNEVPTSEGNLTDGNGIIVDDTKYTQSKYLSKYNLENIRIDTAVIGANQRLPYNRPMLIEGNLCYFNGGSGVQCFEAVGVKVKNNTCVGNRQRTRYNGQYSNLGQISLQNSKNCEVCNCVMQSLTVRQSPSGSCYAASEINETANSGGNRWYNNLLHSTAGGPKVTLRNDPSIDFGAIYEDPKFVSMVRGNYDFRAVNGNDRGVTWGGGHEYVDLLGRVVSGEMKTDLGAIQTTD
jgi:hypothetical protein